MRMQQHVPKLLMEKIPSLVHAEGCIPCLENITIVDDKGWRISDILFINFCTLNDCADKHQSN